MQTSVGRPTLVSDHLQAWQVELSASMVSALLSSGVLSGQHIGCRRSAARSSRVQFSPARRTVCNAAQTAEKDAGFKMMRKGIKEAADDTVLTPRFYTTDFDEMERLFSLELNPNIDMAEIEACLREFRTDYNQTHFVRNDSFKAAADKVQGDTRKIFIEFLERSCTAEFSGFLLYKELGRRLKKTNPAVAEIFSLMVRTLDLPQDVVVRVCRMLGNVL